MTIEQTEFTERRRRLSAGLRSLELDAILVSGLPNVRYLSGFTGSNAMLLLSESSATLFTDPRYTLQAAEETRCKVVIAKKPLAQTAAGVAGRRRFRRVAVEYGRLTYAGFSELQRHVPKGLAWVPVPDLIEKQRMVKSAGEVELIRASVQTNSRAFDKALSRMKPKWSENDLAAEIDYQVRRFGAEGVAFESIVAAGPRSALPHARPTGESVGADRLLLIDIGAMQAGYASDMTRVVHLGKPPTKAKRLYRAVLEAQLAAIDAVREGVTAAAVDAAARRVLKAHQLDRYFIHSTGHGLGLEIHEAPRLGKRDKTRLEAGMVVTVEPGAYLEGFGGVRIEDTVLVTPTGCEVLTPTAKELLVM